MIIWKKYNPKVTRNLKNYYVIGLIKKYLIHLRMLKYFVRHGMVVVKIHMAISSKQSKC